MTRNASKQGRRRHFLDRYYNDNRPRSNSPKKSVGRRAVQILRKFLDPAIPAGIPLEEARQLLAEYDNPHEKPPALS